MGAGTNPNVVAKTPVVKVMFAFPLGFAVGRNFLALITGSIEHR
jgi:hypothetical protein